MHTSPLVLRFFLLSLLLFSACGRAEEDLDAESLALGSSAGLSALSASDLAAQLVPLDALASAPPTAAADAARARASALGGCVTAEGTAEAPTVRFADGCVVATGQTVSGTVQLAFEASGAGSSVTIVFEEVVVDARTIDGTVSVAVAGGVTTLALALETTRGTAAGALTLSADEAGVQLDGTLDLGASVSLDFAAVRWERDDCYPSGGALTVDTGPLAQTVTFDAETPLTGEVVVTQGPLVRTATLPAYGACPMGGGDAP